MSLIDDAIQALRSLPENMQEAIARAILDCSAREIEEAEA
jgi:hypothetical protein